MSRYVEVALTLRDTEEIAIALASLGIAVEHGTDGLMLRGGLECAGAPVDLRVAAGPFDTIEDFGFARRDDGSVVLVCGELDRARLDARLVPAMLTAVAAHRVDASTELEVVARGPRLVVRRRG